MWELLVKDKYADGKPRPLPTIKVDRIPGGYIVALQDHATRLAIRIQVRQLGDMVRALEKALSDPDAAWSDFDSFKVSEKELAQLLK